MAKGTMAENYATDLTKLNGNAINAFPPATSSIENATTSRPLNEWATRRPPTARRVAGHLLRAILLDVPMFLIFFSYMSLLGIQRIHDLYLSKQMEAMSWTTERAANEFTYYDRNCTVDDLSTRDPNDLFLSWNATAEEAYRHNLKHGFSLFRDVLSEDTASDLRQYIRQKSNLVTEEENFPLKNKRHRYTFGLDLRDPAVAKAIQEFASHRQLSEAVELILGKHAALIEMGMITSMYGAIDQPW